MRRFTLPAFLPALLFLLGLTAQAGVEAKTFHFGTHAARTNVTFTSEADLETIHGHTNVLSGRIAVDASGRIASGSLTIPVASLKTGIDLRDEHLRGAMWLDAARHPSIALRIEKAAPGANARTWTYDGTLTVKGVERPWKGTVYVRYVPEDVARKARLGPGAWVRVKTTFDLRLSDFGIRIPQGIGPKVSEVWKVAVDLYGTTAKPAPRGRP